MRRVLKYALPPLFLVTGLVCAGVLFATSGGAEKAEQPPSPLIVEVTRVAPETIRARVEGSGIVEAALRVEIAAEVAGRVVEVSPRLVPGAEVRAGESLARIDSRDYQAGVQEASALVRQRELELELERGRQVTAAREWEVLGGGRSAAEAPLAVRAPHLGVAEASLEAARGALVRAQAGLARTRVTAPFDAVVVRETADPGDWVGPGTPIAVLVGRDEARVSLGVPVDRLIQLDQAEGSVVQVIQDLPDGGSVARAGRVLGVAGELDAQSRTATIVISIPDPFGGDGLPLYPGAFVRAEIEGRTIPDAFVVPRDAVQDGVVWIAVDGVLRRRAVEIAWQDAETAAIVSGLAAGDAVVVTPMAVPVDGMPIQVVSEAQAQR
jgi:RND family efflux transporter MFP subunit